MIEHRYILEKYTGKASRHTCPECEKPGQFAKYIDTENGEALGDNVGKCNRIDKCGFHYTPKQYFDNNGIKPQRVEVFTPKPQPHQPVGFIDAETFNNSLQGYDTNNLIKYLDILFKPDIVNHLINIYKIGTSARYNGGTTVFWQIDTYGKVRTGKLIKYDTTGHRIKNLNNWVHSVLNIDNFNLKQCLFGEHLLKEAPGQKVGIVESEKTAIIASVYFPELIWLATGGAENLNKEKIKPLRGRNVILFPDASKEGRIYKKWKEKAEQFGFDISNYLEQYATKEQKAEGVDIADFLVNQKQVRKPEPKPMPVVLFEDGCRTYQIPYSTPSPVAVIDSKIENPPLFKRRELLIKSRVFTSANGDKIELVGLSDYGYCKNWKKHERAGGYCQACILNCLHLIRVNGQLQSKEYTQLEVLVMAYNGQNYN